MTGRDLPTRNVAADPFEPPVRPSRAADDDPFLPADDPLSAEAWQLELDEAPLGETTRRRCPSSTLGRLRRRAARAANRPRREAAASPHPGPGERHDAAGPAPRARAAGALVPRVTIAVPRVVTGSSLVADQTALALIGVNAASVLVMALLLAVRMGGIPSPVVIRLDAAGNPDLWGPPSVLWRLPVMSLFITIMFLVVAWFLHPIDRFAARFALGAAIVAQLDRLGRRHPAPGLISRFARGHDLARAVPCRRRFGIHVEETRDAPVESPRRCDVLPRLGSAS